jgi:hypothetical protein
VLICWLALLLASVAERSDGQSWPAIRRKISRFKQITLAGEAGTINQTTPLHPGQVRKPPGGREAGCGAEGNVQRLLISAFRGLDLRRDR